MGAAFGMAALQQGIKDTSEFGWGQLGSILNTKRAWGAQKNAQKESYKNIKEGLRRAGFNPILAVGGKGLAGANVPQLYQAGQTPGSGSLGGSSAKDIASMPDALKMLKNQEDESYWRAQEAHFSALDKQRRFRALEPSFDDGSMNYLLKMQETPEWTKLLTGAAVSSGKKLADEFLEHGPLGKQPRLRLKRK